MQLNILSPDKTIFKGEAAEVSAPGKTGYLQILNKHAPIISVLNQGTIKYTPLNQNRQHININGGILHTKNNTTTILLTS